MLNMRVWRSVVLFITFFVLSLNCATAEDPNFDFGGKAGKTYAIVSGETFKLNVEIGTKEDYPEPKMVKLLIDGCVIELKAEVDSDVGILYTIKEDGKARSPVNNVKLISIKNSDIVTFRGKTSTTTECPVISEIRPVTSTTSRSNSRVMCQRASSFHRRRQDG